MTSLADYARHSPYSDPGAHAPLLDALPTDVRELTAVVRNVVVHFRAAGITFTGDRLAEIDSRWLDRILATDQGRFPVPLGEPRPEEQRVVGCCRDFTLLTVAALRHRGVPARSRVGFATYFGADWRHDHVIAEYWDGRRWVFVDAQPEPGPQWPAFDTCDMPYLVGAKPPAPPVFETAAQAWTAYRRGEIDADRYGVDPAMPFKGPRFVRDEVLIELAHRQRDELLLWDVWGDLSADMDAGLGDVGLVDEVAGLLLAADEGDEAAERELARRYAADPRLHPGATVECFSPTGRPAVVDLTTRQAAVAAG
jgi:hypothetical protein